MRAAIQSACPHFSSWLTHSGQTERTQKNLYSFFRRFRSLPYEIRLRDRRTTTLPPTVPANRSALCRMKYGDEIEERRLCICLCQPTVFFGSAQNGKVKKYFPCRRFRSLPYSLLIIEPHGAMRCAALFSVLFFCRVDYCFLL